MPTDKLTIDTPEQVHLEFVLADIGSRFMAVLADLIIQILLVVGVTVMDQFVLHGSVSRALAGFQMWLLAILGFLGFVVYWGYYAIFEALWNGQPPGKRLGGIRVIKDSGRRINDFEDIGRNLMRVEDELQGFYGFGLIVMVLNSRNRRIGDFVAGTLVVHDKRLREPELFFNSGQQKKDFVIHQAARLGAGEIELIETFLSRRLDIPAEVRRQSAARIAALIGSKLGLANTARPASDEDFLELIVKEFRDRAQYR